jgi:hypothetical protein
MNIPFATKFRLNKLNHIQENEDLLWFHKIIRQIDQQIDFERSVAHLLLNLPDSFFRFPYTQWATTK